ncbi:MAG: endonuclease/exonuclease/phosphatase family protein [Marinilabilia sp.]
MTVRLYLILFFALIMLGAGCDDEGDGTKSGQSFSDCVTNFEQGENFEVVTFNIQEFPKENNTIMHTAELLSHINADVVALQEITTEGALKELADQMEGWEYVFTPDPTSYNMSLGYLVKMTEVELIEEETDVWFEDESHYFPRSPFVIKVRHRDSGTETWLVNLHLKAGGDDESVDRRRVASNMLKEHIDTYYSGDHVIVAGDFNDELDEEKDIDDVFANFTVDEEAYRFTDMGIARGDEEYFSYPGWPSHIDHILITDEWFGHFDTSMTLRPDECFDNYEDYISDHRPVVAIFEFD